MASAQESSNQMANGGSRQPKEKSRRGNWVLRRPTETSQRGNRKSRRPKEKSQRGNRVLRRPLEKLRHGNRVLCRPLGKSWHGNWWIAPASWKIVARQLADCTGHLKIRGGGLATISKDGDGLRKRGIRIKHGAPLKREASGRIMT